MMRPFALLPLQSLVRFVFRPSRSCLISHVCCLWIAERWRDEQADQVPLCDLAGTQRQHDEASPAQQRQGSRQGNHHGINQKTYTHSCSNSTFPHLPTILFL